MKIAVTYEDNQVFQHFGKCPAFALFEVEDGIIKNKTLLNAAGSGHSALAGFLKDAGADVIICGGIGAGAQQALAGAGIALCAGVRGDVDAAVAGYLSGNIEHNPNPTCNHHHGEEGGHNCGSHSCGGHC